MKTLKRFLSVICGLFIINSAFAYTVTYNCGTGGGNAPTTNTTATLNESFTPATNTCAVPNGYSFSGWLIGGTNTVVNNAFTWAYNEDKTLTAQYSPNTININWWNGDTQLSVQNTAQSCTYGGTLAVPSQPTKPGYTFNGWKVIDVPGNCKRIEYIESNGTDTQYIDTGVPGDNNNYRIVIDFMMLNFKASNEDYSVISNYVADTVNTWRIALYHGVKLLFYTNTRGHFPRPSWNYSPDPRANYRYLISMDYNHLVINGTEYVYDNLHVGTPNNATIKLFPIEDYNTLIKLRVYSFIVYDNENLIRNMIPVKDSNNVPCMYDKVSGQFFYNVGTGNFIAGPEI